MTELNLTKRQVKVWLTCSRLADASVRFKPTMATSWRCLSVGNRPVPREALGNKIREGESETVNCAIMVVVSFGERTEEKGRGQGGVSRRTGSQEANAMDTQPLFQIRNKKTGRSKNEIEGGLVSRGGLAGKRVRKNWKPTNWWQYE